MNKISNTAKKTVHPPGYVLAASVISLGGFINGYDTGSIGAVTSMPTYEDTIGILSPAMRGFTVSLIMLTGAAPAILAGQLADRFGRLQIIMAGALIFALGAILQGAAYQLPMFLVGRALGGLGEGLWLSNMTIYICEIAPSARRGTLVSTPQFMCTLGICAGYFTCYGSIHLNGTMQWRTPFVVQAGLALLLAIGCLVVPHSPRWLLLQGKRGQAIKELDRLDFSRVEAEKDLLGPAAEQQSAARTTTLESFLIIFRRQYRSRTLLALFVLGMAQLCGIDGVLYYAPTLFAQAGLPSQTASFLASGVSAILMLLISIPAVLFADRWDRRTSVVSGGVILSGCMLLIGCLYVTDSVHAYGSGRWVVVVSIFAFALTYCVTWAVAGKIYASEIQPNNTRAAANSLAQGVSFFTNWLVAITTPIFLANSSFGAYFLFGFLSLGTVAVLALYMPETRGLSLESIQETFHKPPMITNLAGHVRRLFGLTVAGARSGSGSEGPTGGQREDGEAIEMSGAVRVASEGPRNSSSAGMAVAGPLRIGAMVV